MAGECYRAPLTDLDYKPHMLADPFRLAILTDDKSAGLITQNTFRFTKRLLIVLSVTLSFALIIFLEVTPYKV